mgnify:CR=1 FL=1
MGILAKIFTWWDGATIGTLLWAGRAKGEHVGTDAAGNKYYRQRAKAAGANDGSYTSREKRWVIYNGANDASRVPAEWHGWLHHTWQEPPTRAPLARKPWEQPHQENLTGTALAYRPRTSILAPQPVAPARDYEAWAPE